MMKYKNLFLVIFLLVIVQEVIAENKVDLYLFYSKSCPHCRAERLFLSSIKDDYPELRIHEYDISDRENAILLNKMCEAYNTKPLGVPMTFIGDRYIIGFGDRWTTGKEIENAIKECIKRKCVDPGNKIGLNVTTTTSETKSTRVTTIPSHKNVSYVVDVPLIGKVNVSKIGLPIFTIIIAGLDGFNPCALWVLCFLLTLLIYAKSRKKMLLIGSIFVFASGFVYFLFMTAWLNFFLLIGYVNLLRIIIAIMAIAAGIINIKDFFFFKKGLSLTIPEWAKPRLFKKMRALVHESTLPMVIFGTIVLAFTANTFELLCTAGFPAIYTRILTLHSLSKWVYYSYLVLYNVVYVIPLAIVVAIFVVTMGAHRFREKHGRILKLIAGLLMLILGLVLLIKPELLTFG